nr:FidL-like protein [Erwinia billingiae]
MKTAPDTLFNKLLAELTLDHSYVQLSVDKVDDKSYLIGAPLSCLFTCKRY